MFTSCTLGTGLVFVVVVSSNMRAPDSPLLSTHHIPAPSLDVVLWVYKQRLAKLYVWPLELQKKVNEGSRRRPLLWSWLKAPNRHYAEQVLTHSE